MRKGTDGEELPPRKGYVGRDTEVGTISVVGRPEEVCRYVNVGFRPSSCTETRFDVDPSLTVTFPD